LSVTYQAGSWLSPRRVIAKVVQLPASETSAGAAVRASRLSNIGNP
jgi:hypothetical protein